MTIYWLWGSWSWNEKTGSNSQSTVLGQSCRHKYWGQFTPKSFKDRTWRVYESDFNLTCLQGADPRGLWQPCEQTICLYLFLQTLLENSFILGNLPCITYHYSLRAVSHVSHALSLFLLYGVLLRTPQHTEFIFHTMALMFIVLYRWLIIINSTIWTIK